MDYLYFLANASLTQRVVEYLHKNNHLPIHSVTVLHQIDGWVVKVKMGRMLDSHVDGNLRAFFSELGIAHQPEVRVKMALWSLDAGEPPIEVMRRYQVAIVSHGRPDREEIETFRRQFVNGLGYCPETLA